MKHKIITGWMVALLLLVTTSSHAEESFPFAVVMMGSFSFADTDVVAKALERSPGIAELHPLRERQGMVEFAGMSSASADQLTRDMMGIVADRFSLEGQGLRNGTLVFTLRKLAPLPPDNLVEPRQ